MNSEEKLDKILENQVQLSTDLAVMKNSLKIHMNDYKETKKSHYDLRDELKNVKAKVLAISSAVAAGLSFIANYLFKVITGDL